MTMNDGRVVLWDARDSQWLHFTEACQVVQTNCLDEVVDALHLVETQVNEQGLYAAGFVCYEAAPAFDRALTVSHLTSRLPLLWFGVFDAPVTSDNLPTTTPIAPCDAWDGSVSQSDYRAAITDVKRCIAAGETYQVNYTFRFRAPWHGDSWDYFRQLAVAQRTGYLAFIETTQFAICSTSPELFFDLDGNTLVTRPMKGTAARGRTLAEDEFLSRQLSASEKERAENIMIVDMMRNDLGRIANPGSVTVSNIFQVEKYPTVWQMTSTVTAQSQASVSDTLGALFPCASVTGAPKASTMSIIARLETDPRGVYTGCIGFIAPGRRAQFNVAIRTMVIDKVEGTAEYGVGGGIMWDSEANTEYQECLLKTRVWTQPHTQHALLETILWTPEDGFFLLDYHLRRMQDSATFFDYRFQPMEAHERLVEVARSLPTVPHKIRLLLSPEGTLRTESTTLPMANSSGGNPLTLRLAAEPVQSSNTLLYHKTTNRTVYEQALSNQEDSDDVLLWNERGEITETTRCNVAVMLDGRLVTPPVSCGLLVGTYRAWMMDQRRLTEQVVTLQDLARAEGMYVFNSVRKWRAAAFKEWVDCPREDQIEME